MNEKGPWAFGLMAIAIAALVARGVLPQSANRVVGNVSSPVEEKKEDQQEEGSSPKKAEAGWTEFCPAPCLYEEFFGLPLTDAEVSWPETAGEIARSAKDQEYELEFLITLVPDPVDSHLSNLFDEALDALHRGIAEADYLFDRVSLPWQGDAAKKRTYRTTPGGLLFRKLDSHGQRRLLAVFLVGESPKGGIQKQAFYTALDFVTELQQEAQQSAPLRILGPSFSGSAESLQIALRKWLARRGPAAASVEIEMMTGSATRRNLETFFPKRLQGAKKVTFERSIADDDLLQGKSYELLEKRLGWQPADIALITEFDTAYGWNTGRWGRTVVQFPSNLAYIRTAREKLGLDRDPDSSNAPASARKTLDLSLADDDKPVDVVPQLNELSTQANDLAMASLLREISHKRYIGILATDLQDRLFLAEQIHSYCPDAVVFTFDSHLLATHPKVAKAMDGTLVITNFPLYPAESQALRQFTSEFQEGIYRAALQLVGKRRQKPSTVWVAAVSNGRLWPIAVRSVELGPLEDEKPPKLPPTPNADRAGLKWLVVGLVMALLGAWIVQIARPLQAAVARFRREDVWTSRGAAFLPAFGAGVVWLASGMVLVFYALPLWYVWYAARLDPEQVGLRLDPEQVGLRYPVLAVLVLIYLWTTYVFAQLAWSPRRWGRALLWLALGVLMPVLLGWAMIGLWLFPEGAEFFYLRAGDFSSGLSPLVSLALLAAGLYSWAIVELKRRRLIVSHDLAWPLADTPEPAFADCKRRATDLWKALERPPGKAFWVVMALLLLPISLRLFRGIQPIGETREYGVLFVVIVMFVFLLSALSFFRFFVAWRRLERVLDRLCNTWLLPVFSRSSNLFDWKPMKSFGLRMPSIKMTLTSAQQLRTLARLDLLEPDGAAFAGGLSESRAALDDHLDRVFKAETEEDFPAEVAARCELRTWFDKSAKFLERVRWTSGSADPVPNDKDGKTVPRPREVEMREIETYLALRVVAHVRYVFAHLRYALAAATICGLALLFAVSSYAFQPKRFLSFGIWMALLFASAMTLRVFMQMDRNGTLSAIGGTDAGKVTLDRTFYSNLLTYGGIPVLGIVLTQFPAVGQLFGGWLGPLLRVVGGG